MRKVRTQNASMNHTVNHTVTSYQHMPLVQRARAIAAPLIGHSAQPTGEPALDNADGVHDILQTMEASDALLALPYLVAASAQLSNPLDVLSQAIDTDIAAAGVDASRLLLQQQRLARAHARQHEQMGSEQIELVRKMLLASSKDLRVILFLLAHHLQNLRYCCKHPDTATNPSYHAQQALEIYAPLANRLGIWQLKWEMEDLSLRIREPLTYREIAGKLNSTRQERENRLHALRELLQQQLQDAGISTTVQARPKHIYSIVKKMRGKNLQFEEVMDIRAMRIITDSEAACYQVLARIHEWFTPVPSEFDDYISQPKANGYQSIHTVVLDDSGMPTEVQIRSQTMHELAESGVAAHWAYKEAGSKGYAGVKADSEYDSKVAMLRQMLLWEQELSQPYSQSVSNTLLSDRIYVFTPDARIISLARNATPVDFAYAVHTDLGHRCRGARVDGSIVALNTPLQSGQQVAIITAKEGGPSQDWLNPHLGYVVGSRARSKIRAWFNARQLENTRQKGREMLEKLLQREGKTRTSVNTLAQQLGYDGADTLHELIGRESLPLKTVASALHPLRPQNKERTAPPTTASAARQTATAGSSSIVVDGVGDLLTQLAKCCRPVAPDAITGFITRGKGISIHRSNCNNLLRMQQQQPERILPVSWSRQHSTAQSFTARLVIQGDDAAAITRQTMDWCGKLKIRVQDVQTHQSREVASLQLLVTVNSLDDLEQLLHALQSETCISNAYRATN